MPYTIIVDNCRPEYGYFEKWDEAHDALIEKGWRKVELQRIDQMGRKNWRQPHPNGDYVLYAKGKGVIHAHIKSARERWIISKLRSNV